MIKFKEFNLKNINSVKDSLVILKNTSGLNSSMLLQIKTNCKFKITGGLFEVQHKDFYDKRVTYTINQMIKILLEIEKIENKIKGDRVIYIYDYLRQNLRYCPEEKNDKKIRSLYALVTKKAVCSGYALILKELLDRQNINCKYINHNHHVWNIITLNNADYEVDLTWDSCVYHKFKSSNIHYFGNAKDLSEKHDNYTITNNHYKNDILNTYQLNKICLKRTDNTVFYLTLLPIGIESKYYIYEEGKDIFILNSLDDMEVILASCCEEIQKKYINDFFSKERIKRKNKDNISYLGYGYFKNGCFYKKNISYNNPYIIKIIIDKDIKIYTNDKNYKIDSENNMEVLKC